MMMTRGNDLHDELFDHEGINLTVDETVEMAGEDCGVLCLGQEKELFGGTAVAKQLLAEFLNELCCRCQRGCLVFFSSGRTMLLFIDSTGDLYLWILIPTETVEHLLPVHHLEGRKCYAL